MIKISLLLLRKGDNPCEYMDDSEEFNETPLPQKKKSFQSHLNMEDITDVDYTHGKRVRKDFKITKVDENHDLCVQSNTLLLADVF